MSAYRYSRWDGSQDPLADLDAATRLTDAYADHMLRGMGSHEAMRRLMERGLPGSFGGLQSLRNRIRELREHRQQDGGLGDALAEFGDELQEIVAEERRALAGDESVDARFNEAVLDNLPSGAAGKIRELQRYEFASAEAEDRFQALLERIRKELLDAQLGQVSRAMHSLTEQDMADLKDMLADLNRMLEQRRAGTGPSDEEFAEFMARHGRFFPDNPQNLDELLEGMAARSAAMSRFLASLSPEQRAELEALSRQLLDDVDLGFELSRLGDNLRGVMPQMPWDRPVDLEGDAMGLGEALDAIEDVSELEDLEACMRQDYPGASLEDVDPDEVRRLLGDDAAHDVDRLREIERMLRDAGMITRRAGRVELTPRGIRRLGERALATVFERLRLDRPGSHELPDAGGFGEPTGSVRPWRFGDPFRIAIGETVKNAVLREGARPDGRIALAPDDFALSEAETRTSTATVLLLDMSRSMPLRGHWVHARRMTFALHTLITSAYPEDRLHVVGFSDYARELRPSDLAAIEWEPVYGTNMEHAFLLAGRLLAKDPATSKQILLVTDGEPTAHLVGDEVFFHWPPVRETIDRTLREALRLARAGITMNVFMLEESPGLVRFVDRLAQLVRGRVFAVPDDELGAVVVSDYLARRAG